MAKIRQNTDIILFMGQSNMAGRGEVADAVVCGEECGWEYRAVTDPKQLHRIQDPFGLNENRIGGINDQQRKHGKGSLVPAFVNAYVKSTGRKVLAVSASEGGTTIEQWEDYLVEDAYMRLREVKRYAALHDIGYEHVFMVWCQGESDGDAQTSEPEYIRKLGSVYRAMQNAGVEHCFLIQIGHFNYVKYPHGAYGFEGKQLDEQYEVIRRAQEHLCRDSEDYTFVGTFKDHMKHMKDEFHYHQIAYNQVGKQAGEATAAYVNLLKS